LTATLRAARPDVIIATDEEGGDVTRLCYANGSPYPGNAALGVVDDIDLTRAIYRAIGSELAAVGITLDMAPAVDVNSADDNPAIGTRSFGADPGRVAAHAWAAVTGLQEAGVAACAKHFPGHGATEMDSHLDLPLVDASVETLWRRELPPFEAAVAAGVRAVMTAHIRVPVLTGDLPATFSPETLLGLLRKDLGFTGAIISDGLEMRGASGAIGLPEAAVRALVAGNDLLCFGGEFAKPPALGALDMIESTVAAIIEAVRVGRLTADRLAESAARNALLAGPGYPSPPLPASPVPSLSVPAAPSASVGSVSAAPSGSVGSVSAAPSGSVGSVSAALSGGEIAGLAAPGSGLGLGAPGSGLDPAGSGLGLVAPSSGLDPAGSGLGLGAARRALLIEGELPSLAGGVVVQLEPPATVAVGEVPWGLAPYRPGVRVLRPAADTESPALAASVLDELVHQAGSGPIVVVSRDTHRHPWARDFVEALSRRHPAVILIEMGWPAAWRPAGAVAYVATHGASRATAQALTELLYPSALPV